MYGGYDAGLLQLGDFGDFGVSFIAIRYGDLGDFGGGALVTSGPLVTLVLW